MQLLGKRKLNVFSEERGKEFKRNSSIRGYSASLAQEYANERKERFRINRKFTDEVQAHVVKCLTEEQWSPKQIVGDAKRHGEEMVSNKFSCFLTMTKPKHASSLFPAYRKRSHERIYQFIREDK